MDKNDTGRQHVKRPQCFIQFLLKRYAGSFRRIKTMLFYDKIHDNVL